METKATPKSPQDLLEEIRREAGYIQTYQFRIEDAIKKQQAWAEQLAGRIQAGETTGDKLWDFVARQESIRLWRNDGGELDYILRQLDQQLEASVGQSVMLVETSIDDWPVRVRLISRTEFEDRLNIASSCFPDMSMFPKMPSCKVRIGRLHRGGLVIEGEKWFLPTLSHTILGCRDKEEQIEDCIPLPPLNEFIVNHHSILKLCRSTLFVLKDLPESTKMADAEILIGVDEIRSWIGKCQSDQIGERILEILDELELPD